MDQHLVIHEIFSQVAAVNKEKTAMQVKKDGQWQKITYAEVEDYSLRIGAFLIKEGFKKRDFAALILENSPEWGMIYLGIVRAGLSCIPLDPQLTSDEIANLLKDSLAKVIFCSSKIFSEKIKQSLQIIPIKFVIIDVERSAIQNVSLDNVAWPQVEAQDVASLIYTSGTTGVPKGVLLTHKNFCSNFMSMRETHLALASDNFLSILPLYHSYAFTVTLLMPLLLGAVITYAESLKAEELNQVIRETRVTLLTGVPQLFSLMHKVFFVKIKKIPFVFRPFLFPVFRLIVGAKFRSLRVMISGGARLEPKVGRDLTRLGLKLIEGYGLTETAPVVSLNPLEKVKFGSVGKPLPGVEIEIFNPDKEGVGEVLIRGGNLMQGYFQQDDLTAQVIRNGWFHSGDLGYIDREGYLFLVGREKEVIVLSSGKNIYPEEIEEYYLQSHYIKEMCIISRKQEAFGLLRDTLFAVIVPDLEYFKLKGEANIREKIRWELDTLGRKLPAYKHIMGFMLSKEDLPRTVLKKIKRYEVQGRYLKEKSIESTAPVLTDEECTFLEKDIAKKIIRYVREEAKKPVYLDSHLEIDLGLDSLAKVELAAGLEPVLKIKIPDEVIYKASTIKELILNIEQLSVKLGAPTPGAEKNWSQILREMPPQEIITKIKFNFELIQVAVNFIMKVIFLFVFRSCWLLKSEGKENLPPKGPYLICSNHASFLDGLFIFNSLPFRISMKTYFLGFQRVFEHPLLGWANKLCRLISVDTASHLAEAMQAVSFVLSKEKIVCIFPEGMRSIDTEVKDFKKGAGILIKELDILVIPAYIKGSHNSWPRGQRFPHLCSVKVIFGKPLSLKDFSAQSYEAITQRLKDEIIKLSK